MIPILRKHADLPGIAASAFCTINIPVMNNHHGLLLNCLDGGVALTQAQMETDIDWVSVTLTTDKGVVKIIDRLTTAEILDLLNDYPDLARDSGYTNAGVLYIPFSRPGRIRMPNWSLSLGMADVQVYTLEVQLTAGLTNLDQMEIIPEVDMAPLRPLGEHVECRIDTRAYGVVGVEQIIDMPHGEPGTALLASHIGLGSAPGVVGDVEVIADNQTLYDSLDAAVNNLLLHRKGYIPNADYFHVALDRSYEPLNIAALKNFTMRINWTTAPVLYRLVHEVIAGVGKPNE